MPVLLIMVDGLPHRKVVPELAPFLASRQVGALEPGIGFSVNLYVELFAGRKPDETGFFNKWMLKDIEDRKDPPFTERLKNRALDLSRVNFAASRVVHKAFERWGHCEGIGNVPFELLPYFTQSPKDDIFGKAAYPTVFNEGEWHILVASYVKRIFGKRDEVVVQQAREAIPTGKNIFVAMTDVDAISHAMGMSSSFDVVAFAKGVRTTLDEHIAKVDRWCEELSERFIAQHGELARIVIVSDHGMGIVDPDGRVDLELEEKFGRPSAKSFLYMYESTMARVWCFDPVLEHEMKAHFSERNDGRLIGPEEREVLGIANRDFAHLIYLLDEPKVLFPNFFGGRFPKAMHGWYPKNSSQLGVIATDGVTGPLPSRAVDVYDFVRPMAADGEG